MIGTLLIMTVIAERDQGAAIAMTYNMKRKHLRPLIDYMTHNTIYYNMHCSSHPY